MTIYGLFYSFEVYICRNLDVIDISFSLDVIAFHTVYDRSSFYRYLVFVFFYERIAFDELHLHRHRYFDDVTSLVVVLEC